MTLISQYKISPYEVNLYSGNARKKSLDKRDEITETERIIGSLVAIGFLLCSLILLPTLLPPIPIIQIFIILNIILHVWNIIYAENKNKNKSNIENNNNKKYEKYTIIIIEEYINFLNSKIDKIEYVLNSQERIDKLPSREKILKIVKGIKRDLICCLQLENDHKENLEHKNDILNKITSQEEFTELTNQFCMLKNEIGELLIKWNEIRKIINYNSDQSSSQHNSQELEQTILAETNRRFYEKHPQMKGVEIPPSLENLKQEWNQIYEQVKREYLSNH